MNYTRISIPARDIKKDDILLTIPDHPLAAVVVTDSILSAIKRTIYIEYAGKSLDTADTKTRQWSVIEIAQDLLVTALRQIPERTKASDV